MPTEAAKKNPWTTPTWIVIAMASVVWWIIASQHLWWRLVLVIGLSLASFMVGCLVGFLFTSYGEESGTVGKIRDWVIGGITGLTIAKAGAIKGLLLTFAAGPGPSEFALTVSSAVSYAVLGFFFMFFQRELIWNVLVAESRAERGRLEGSQQAGQVIQQLLVKLPASLLTGVDYIDEVPEVNEGEAKGLKELLYSEDVEKFLKQAEDTAKGGCVDWDIASKAAHIYYYRTYFEKGEQRSEVDKAVEWIIRALNMNPLHVDLTMKYADMLGANEEYEAAAAVLEKLAPKPEAPLLVKQWLGYYLRFLPDRLDDAIRYSEEYHRLFPDESDSFFNVAYAYAQKYCLELRTAGTTEDTQSKNRASALSTLKEALREDPKMKKRVRDDWTQPGEGFDCFLHDKDFRSLVGLPEEQVTTVPSSDKPEG